MAREACAAHPPTSREPTPVRGVALVLGGQNPITLEYQIYPPPIDTLVTGMGQSIISTRIKMDYKYDQSIVFIINFGTG